MAIKNVEIKARCESPARVRKLLKREGADFAGIDHQVDTYFNVPEGRLKLRQGTIEQNLIFYRRNDSQEPKLSDINLIPADQPDELYTLLTNALGQKIVVDKRREIYFINNVKFHIDNVEGLGKFMEIEAIDNDGSIVQARLEKQCRHYLDLFEIKQEDLVSYSYSDLLLRK